MTTTTANDEQKQSDLHLSRIKKDPATARHTLCVCILSTMQNQWQNQNRAGQDNLPLDASEIYPEDLYNLYMLLHSLDQEAP